jgi:hypothetical protein
MRALGLFLLLAGCLVLLWPVYGHLLHIGQISRANTQLYGGATVLGGVAMLLFSRLAAR